MAHVGERAPNAAGTRGPGWRRVKLGGVHRPKREDHHDEGERVDREARLDPPEGDHEARQCRPDDPRGVDDHAVQADDVHDPVRADDLDHEALPGRVVDRVRGAAQEDEGEDHPRLDDARDGEREERQRRHRHRRLRDQQEPPLREPVGQQPAPGADQQERQELQRRGEADVDARSGQGEDQPHLRDDLHPVPGQGDDLAAEEAAVVRDLERGERCAQGGRQARSRSSSRSRIRAARSSVSSSSGSSPARRRLR